MKKEKNLCQPYMTENVIFARQKTEFVNPLKGIRKTIVDRAGQIQDFPGFANPEIVLNLMEGLRPCLPSSIHYRTEFHLQPDGTHLMVWEIQPDGRYWADEGGFGMEDDDEIRVYAYLNDTGDFLTPFRIYDVGEGMYFGTDREDQLARERAAMQGSDFQKSMDRQLPAIQELVKKTLDEERRGDQFLDFDIAGISHPAQVCFFRTSKGGHLRFCLLRDEERYRGCPHFICTMGEGSETELRSCLIAPRWWEKTKEKIWHYCSEFDDFYEELLREKKSRT